MNEQLFQDDTNRFLFILRCQSQNVGKVKNMSESKPFEQRCSPEGKRWLEIFTTGTGHLSNCAENLHDNPWDQNSTDPRRAHNAYVHNLVSVYFSKHAKLSKALVLALNNDDYLTYALCGRSLIELVSTLKYYVANKYKPLFDKGSLNLEDLQALVKIDDQHLRGSRFDWESFLFRRYAKLMEDTRAQIKAKKEGKRHGVSSTTPDQVNVTTCIDKWAGEMPEVQMIYNLFCDLVHPNIGSNFLVASVNEGTIHFAQNKGEMIGHSIFEESFPLLVSLVIKPFVTSLNLLMVTRWQEDEVSNE
jgi:hypothetical protein